MGPYSIWVRRKRLTRTRRSSSSWSTTFDMAQNAPQMLETTSGYRFSIAGALVASTQTQQPTINLLALPKVIEAPSHQHVFQPQRFFRQRLRFLYQLEVLFGSTYASGVASQPAG